MRTLKRAVRMAVQSVSARAARPYVVGPALPEAMRVARTLQARGLSGTLSYWSARDAAARSTADSYLAAIRAISDAAFDGQLSVRTPPLFHSRDLFAEIAACARARQVTLHFDSTSAEAAPSTFALIGGLRSDYNRLGCTLPGRWRRSTPDADWAVERGLRVRVVRGRWADPGRPDLDPRAGFLAVVDRLAVRATQALARAGPRRGSRDASRTPRGSARPPSYR